MRNCHRASKTRLIYIDYVINCQKCGFFMGPFSTTAIIYKLSSSTTYHLQILRFDLLFLFYRTVLGNIDIKQVLIHENIQ